MTNEMKHLPSYDSLVELQDIYLEDSFVLGFQLNLKRLTFEMEFVLLESHDAYQPPTKDVMYCYKRGQIIFSNIRHLTFEMSGNDPFTDATGEADYGNIDSFIIDGPLHLLEGDWGNLSIDADLEVVMR